RPADPEFLVEDGDGGTEADGAAFERSEAGLLGPGRVLGLLEQRGCATEGIGRRGTNQEAITLEVDRGAELRVVERPASDQGGFLLPGAVGALEEGVDLALRFPAR